MTALETEPFAFGESPAELRATPVAVFANRLRESGGFVMGAFDGPSPAGMAGLYRERHLKRRHKATIWGVYVRVSHRGMGVGRALIAAVLEEARRLPELRQVQLSVAATQHGARALYASLGFRSYGTEPAALMANGEYVDEEHMYLPVEGIISA